MQSKQQRIFEFQIDAAPQKINLAVSFPCQVGIQWKRGQQKLETQSKPQIDKGIALFNEVLTLRSKLQWEDGKGFQEKQSQFTLFIVTAKGNKVAGYSNFDLAKFVTFQNKKFTEELKLEKCPDKNAVLTVEFQITLIGEINSDQTTHSSQASSQTSTPFWTPIQASQTTDQNLVESQNKHVSQFYVDSNQPKQINQPNQVINLVKIPENTEKPVVVPDKIQKAEDIQLSPEQRQKSNQSPNLQDQKQGPSANGQDKKLQSNEESQQTILKQPQVQVPNSDEQQHGEGYIKNLSPTDKPQRNPVAPQTQRPERPRVENLRIEPRSERQMKVDESLLKQIPDDTNQQLQRTIVELKLKIEELTEQKLLNGKPESQQVQILRQKIISQNEAIEKQNKIIQKMNEQFSQGLKRNNILEKIVTRQEEEISNLKNNEDNDMKITLRNQITRLVGQRDTAQSESQQVLILRQKIISQNEAIEKQNKIIQKMNEQFSQGLKRNNILENIVARQEEEISNLKNNEDNDMKITLRNQITRIIGQRDTAQSCITLNQVRYESDINKLNIKHENEIQDLIKTINALKAQVTQFESKNKIQESLIQGYQESLAKINVSGATDDMSSSLRSQITKLQGQRDAATRTMQQEKQRFEDRFKYITAENERQIQKLKNDIKLKNDEIEELTNSLSKSKQEIVNLELNMVNPMRMSNPLEDLLNTEESNKIQRLYEEEIQNLKKQAEEFRIKSQNETNNFRNQIQGFQQENEKLQLVIVKSSNQIEELQDALNKEKQSFEQLNLQLQSQISKSKKENDQLQENINEVTQAKTQLEDQTKTLRSENEQVKIQLRDLKVSHLNIEQQLSSIRDQNQLEIENLKHEIILQQNQNQLNQQKLNEQMQLHKDRAIQLQDQITQLNKQIEEYWTKIKEFEEKQYESINISKDPNFSVDQQDQSSSFIQLENTYKLKYDSEMLQNKQLKQQNEQLNRKIDELQLLVTDLQSQLAQSENTIKKSNFQIEVLQKQLENFKSGQQIREDQLKTSQNQFIEQMQLSHQYEIKKLEQEKDQLQDKISRIQKTCDGQHDQIVQQNQQIQLLNFNLNQDKDNVSKRDQDIELLKADIKLANEQIQNKQQLISNLEQNMREFTQLKNLYQEQSLQIEKIQILREQEKIQIQKLRDQLQYIDDQYNQMLLSSNKTDLEHKKEILNFKTMINQLEKGLEEKTQMEKLVDQLKIEIKRSQDDRNSLATKLALQGNQLKEKQSIVLEKDQQIYKLQENLAQMNSLTLRNQEEINLYKKEINKLNVEKFNEQQKLNQIQQEAEKKIEELTENNKVLEEIRIQKENQLEDLKLQIKNLNKSIAKLRQIEEQNNQLQEELNKSKCQVGEIMNVAFEIGGMEMVDRFQKALKLIEYL